MVLCLILILGMAALLLLSASVRLPRGCRPPKGQRAFFRAAYYLLRRVPGRERRPAEPFEVERLARVLLVLFCGAGLSLLVQAAVSGTTFLVDGNGLNRPESGELSRELQVKIGEAQTEQIEVVVAERRYTEAEKQEFLAQAVAELETLLPGENVSPDAVRGSVFLPETLADGKVSAVWTQEPAGLLDGDGKIAEDLPEDGALLQLEAVLSCGGAECVYECALNLMPPLYTQEEELQRALREEVKKADEDSAQESVLRLPEEVDGQPLTWRESGTSVTGVCLLLTVFAAVCAWIAKNQELQKEQEQRRRQMTMDYPDLLFKLSMLLNAGLTMQNAFMRIAGEYRDRADRGVRYAYEEMLTACREMNSGVPEARAYENFGRRCGGSGYAKLGTMLSSNLQKGSEGLADILQQEAQLSMEERRQMAKKLGEEAGTKLLLPMVLMLLVVLVILLVPAMLAF